MNKAFIREPDDPTDPRCPACRAIGHPVSPETLEAHLPAELARTLSSIAAYCPGAHCQVGYFDNMDQTVPASAIDPSIYPKDPSAPVCLCLGLTAEEVEADASRADPTRVRRAIEHSQSTEARCTRLTPNARPCTAEIQQLYLKHLSKPRKNR